MFTPGAEAGQASKMLHTFN